MTNFELLPISEPGRRFVSLAERHAAAFAERATAHDRDGSFPFENFDEMQKSGVMTAPIPRDFGGLGVESLHDIMIGMSRIGRGDASTAIAANMHIAGAAVLVRMFRRVREDGDEAVATILQRLLEDVGAGEVIMCFPTTEPGTDLNSPTTEAKPVPGGYVVNGKKIFGTISPAAHLFFPSVRIPKDTGEGYLTATVMIPRDTPGFKLLDDWDAMGMRASGSNGMAFTDCFVPKTHVFGIKDNYAKVGRGFADFALNANLPLISTFLGIAEAARDIAVDVAKRQRKGPTQRLLGDRISIQQIIADIEIHVAVSRSLVSRLGQAADAFLAKYATRDPPQEESAALMKEVQCMKFVVNRNATEVVDRAMHVCGGAAYMNKHPLSRLYRDSRAGPFMQPFAPYEAFEYIGKVALGLEPALDR